MADSKMRRNSSDDEIKVIKWENKSLGISLWVIKTKKEFWVFGKDVATALEYANPKEALQDHITCEEDKRSLKNLLGDDFRAVLQRKFPDGSKNLPSNFFQKLHPNQILINELGIYSFCVRSRMPKAIPFQRWVYKTIKTIRETGSYTLPDGPIDNPLDLLEGVKTTERKIVKTCDKETQTNFTKDTIIKKSLKKLSKIEKSIVRVEIELENCLKSNSSTNSSCSDSD